MRVANSNYGYCIFSEASYEILPAYKHLIQTSLVFDLLFLIFFFDADVDTIHSPSLIMILHNKTNKNNNIGNYTGNKQTLSSEDSLDIQDESLSSRDSLEKHLCTT